MGSQHWRREERHTGTPEVYNVLPIASPELELGRYDGIWEVAESLYN